jgi:hypothetical protein
MKSDLFVGGEQKEFRVDLPSYLSLNILRPGIIVNIPLLFTQSPFRHEFLRKTEQALLEVFHGF